MALPRMRVGLRNLREGRANTLNRVHKALRVGPDADVAGRGLARLVGPSLPRFRVNTTWLRGIANERGMIAVPRIFRADSSVLADAGAVMREASGRQKSSLDPRAEGMTPATEGSPPHLDPMAIRARIDHLDRPAHHYLDVNIASAVLKELIKIAEELASPGIHRVMALADILALFNRMMEIAAKLPIAWEALVRLAIPMGQVGFRSRAAAIIRE